MLDGWRNQQLARNLAFGTIIQRERVIRRFISESGELPWQWSAAMADEWLGDLRALHGLKQSTIRSLSMTLRMFCGYLVDPAYGWAEECWSRFQAHPVQVCHAWNTAAHVQATEASPAVRAFTLEELQRFFDAADDLVTRAQRLRRKGALTAFRDARLFKTTYAWVLRRQETRMLDLVDFGTNPQAPSSGVGACSMCVMARQCVALPRSDEASSRCSGGLLNASTSTWPTSGRRSPAQRR